MSFSIERYRLAASVVVAAAVLVGACGASEPPDAEPVTTAPDSIATGETIYQAKCASCHGIDLRGTDKGPSHLSVVYEPNHHGDIAFELAIKTGTPQHHWRFGDMAPIEGMTDEDIAAVTAYVREQQQIHGFEPYPP